MSSTYNTMKSRLRPRPQVQPASSLDADALAHSDEVEAQRAEMNVDNTEIAEEASARDQEDESYTSSQGTEYSVSSQDSEQSFSQSSSGSPPRRLRVNANALSDPSEDESHGDSSESPTASQGGTSGPASRTGYHIDSTNKLAEDDTDEEEDHEEGPHTPTYRLSSKNLSKYVPSNPEPVTPVRSKVSRSGGSRPLGDFNTNVQRSGGAQSTVSPKEVPLFLPSPSDDVQNIDYDFSRVSSSPRRSVGKHQ